MNNIANNTSPSTPWNNSGSSSNGTVSNPGANLTPLDVSGLLNDAAINDETLQELERASKHNAELKAQYEALKQRQKAILWMIQGYLKANPKLSVSDVRTILSIPVYMSDDEIMDNLQGGLDAAGLIPVLGEGFDLLNAGISGARGDWDMAGLSVGSMIPIVGDAIGKGAKLALKHGDDIVDAAKGIGKVADKLNLNIVDGKYLKRLGIDAHELKKDVYGQKADIDKYDIYVNKNTGELFTQRKPKYNSGNEPAIPTGEYIK